MMEITGKEERRGVDIESGTAAEKVIDNFIARRKMEIERTNVAETREGSSVGHY